MTRVALSRGEPARKAGASLPRLIRTKRRMRIDRQDESCTVSAFASVDPPGCAGTEARHIFPLNGG
jgi:hypothetical protein